MDGLLQHWTVNGHQIDKKVGEKTLSCFSDDENINLRKRDNQNIDCKKYKTELCKKWSSGFCEFNENCIFAHGSDDLRAKINEGKNKKSKECNQFFDMGYCIYGSRCQFSHRRQFNKNTESSKMRDHNCYKYSGEKVKGRLPVFIKMNIDGFDSFQNIAESSNC